jgi:hypothetical protein
MSLVLVGNERAQRFYRQDGWTSDDRIQTKDIFGVRAEVTRYRRGIR